MSTNSAGFIARAETKLIPLATEVFSDDLVSILLYGSAARGSWNQGVSDINILILLEKSYPRRIFLFGKKARNILHRYRITPLLMSRAEFAGSADVFPMEYADMAQAHRVLYGEVPDFPRPTRTNLRHQLEERLRGGVNDLRQMLIAAGGRDRILAHYLKNWSGAPKMLFRGLGLLKGSATDSPRPEEPRDLISREYGVDGGVFRDLDRLRGGEKVSAPALAEALLEALKALAAAVDAMQGGEA